MIKRFVNNKVLLLLLTFFFKISFSTNRHYYCTSADERFFPRLMNLIRSIKMNDAQGLGEILVFNLGFTERQKQILQHIERVKVLDIEKTHPDILVPFKTSAQGRMVRGWFAWKPVAIKQALDRYPYILYLDAGLEVLKPLDILFSHIIENGYFLIDAGQHSIIKSRITKPVIDKVLSKFSEKQQRFFLDQELRTISAGIQGLSRKVYHSYVYPVYLCASDLSVFEDEGSAQLGFGAGRHDQMLFSIYAYLNNMKMYSEGFIDLLVNGKSVTCHLHWTRSELNKDSLILY